MDITKFPKLIGSSNYDLWSIRMEALLIERDYADVKNNAVTLEAAGNNESLYRELLVKTNKASALIKLTLGDGPLLQSRYISDANILWNNLKKLYGQQGFSAEFISCKELINTTLKTSKNNMEVYIHNIKRLLNTLASSDLVLPPKFVVALVLNNLSLDYDYTVAMITQTIRLSEKEIDLDQIFSQLLDESKRLGKKADTKDIVDVEMTLPTKSNKPKKPKCTSCNKKGHTEEKCWIKHPELKPKTINNTSELDNREESILITNQVLKTKSSIEWVLDSGATIYICNRKDIFQSITPTDKIIIWGNSRSSIKASGVGTISIIFTSTNEPAILKDVLYIPELQVNLISVNQVIKNGVVITSSASKTKLTKNGKPIAEAIYKNKLIILETKINKQQQLIEENEDLIFLTESVKKTKNQVFLTDENQITQDPWHARLAHPNNKVLSKLQDNVEGAIIKDNSQKDCTICIQAKLTRNISKEPSTNSSRYLHKIHIDIGGPITPKTPSGYRYYITFLDNYSRYLSIELLLSRKDIHEVIIRNIRLLERQAPNNEKLAIIQTDNEFKSKALAEYLLEKGIIIAYSAPYTPEQNGIAERVNRTLLNKVRALLFNANLPAYLWGEAIIAATYLYNRTPNSSLSFKTPYEMKLGKKPNISNIKIWGSLAYQRLPNQVLNKLDPRSKPCYLIGYGSNQYKLLDFTSNKTIWSRDVKILEGRFRELPLDSLKNPYISEDISDIESADSPNISDQEDIEDEIALVTSNNQENLIDPNNWQSLYNQLLEQALITDIEPTSYQEIMTHPDKEHYLEACNQEINQLIKNNIWTLVPKPNQKVLQGRWVFNKKIKPDSSIKYKACWVVKGYI